MSKRPRSPSSSEDDPNHQEKKLNRTSSMAQFVTEIFSTTTNKITPFMGSSYGAESFVPKEVLILIFSWMSKGVIRACRCVSKYWMNATLDSSLNWGTLGELELRDFVDHEGYYGRYFADITAKRRNSQFKEFVHKHRKQIPVSFGKASQHFYKQDWKGVVDCIELLNKKMKPMAFVCENYGGDKNNESINFSLVENMCFNERPWSIDCYIIKNNADPPQRTWRLEFNISFSSILHFLQNSLPIPAIDLIFDLVQSKTRLIPEIPSGEAHFPSLKTKLAQIQPKGLSLSLYKYQLNAVYWMKTTEENTKGINFCNLVPWSDGNTTLLLNYTPDQTEIVTLQSQKAYDYVFKLYGRGGVLADEMGLGKTVEVIALILANPAKEKIVVDEKLVWTKATLVICPNHLVKQWAEEVPKFVEAKLKVITIPTINNHRKLSFKDVVKADLVIVSSTFLVNKKYLKEKNSFPNKNLSSSKAPALDSFHWHRIVLDESHEIIKNPKLKGFNVNAFVSQYRWCVSGTPFPSTEVLMGTLKFLSFTSTYPSLSSLFNHHSGSFQDDFLLSTLADIMLSTFYWRNTKHSIKDEYTIPPYVGDTQFLDYHPTERALYSIIELSRSADSILEIIGNPKSFFPDLDGIKISDIPKFLIKQKQSSLVKLEVELIQLTEEIKQLSKELKHTNRMTESEIEALKNLLRKASRSKTGVEEQMELARKAIKYCEQADIIISKSELPIKQRFNEILEKFKEIREKRNQIKLSQITVKELQEKLTNLELDETGNKQELLSRLQNAFTMEDQKTMRWFLEEVCISDLVEFHGTKLAHLVLYLMNLWTTQEDARVIIFSRLPLFLKQLKELLANYNIESTFVKGNVYQRNKAIGDFKSLTKARVIMLSLENAASGTNLIEATHIIFVDPMTGSKLEAQATESQAIGRAYRQGQKHQLVIVRFVVRDTWEEKLFLRNNTEEEGVDPKEAKLKNPATRFLNLSQ